MEYPRASTCSGPTDCRRVRRPPQALDPSLVGAPGQFCQPILLSGEALGGKIKSLPGFALLKSAAQMRAVLPGLTQCDPHGSGNGTLQVVQPLCGFVESPLRMRPPEPPHDAT